eukprot:gene22862-31164_t
MHSFVRRSLRTEFVSNARSLESMYFRRFLSSTQENDGVVVTVRKGTVNPLLIPIIGSERASWKEAVKKVWDYVKVHSLQDKVNKKEINCDAKLSSIFGGKTKILQSEIFTALKDLLIYDPLTEQEKKAIRALSAKKLKEARALKKLEAAQQTAEVLTNETQKVENQKETAKKTKKSKAALSETEEVVKQTSAAEKDVSEKAAAKKKTTRTRAKKEVPAAN